MRSRRALMLPIIMGVIILYLVFHMLKGERGLFSLYALKEDVKASHSLLEELENKKRLLEKKVNSLKGTHIDKDLLDEKVRYMLNKADKKDIIVLT